MTIGIVLVACWAAWVAAPLIATMTSTLQNGPGQPRGGVAIILALGPSGLDGDVLTVHIAQLAQALAERPRDGAVLTGQKRSPGLDNLPGHLLRGCASTASGTVSIKRARTMLRA